MSTTDTLTPTESDTSDAVLIERRGAALWLRLNRPHTLNGISLEIIAGLHRGLDAAARDADVRAVVLAAQGRAFCAGANLKDVESMNDADNPRTDGLSGQQAFMLEAGTVFDRIEAFPKPVIASVHGLALAGGLEMVLCADLVIAAESARFGDSHANYGLLPGAGASIRLPRRIGPARAKHLMFTGDNFPAREFLDTDLVTTVVADDELESHVDGVVEKIAAKSPAGLRRMKKLVNDGLEVPIPVGLRMEQDHAAAHETSHDFREGLAAFNEKRSPKFIGR